MLDVRHQFPFFSEHQELVYLDNASTTQKPQRVLDAIDQFYRTENANSGRGSYPLATQTTNKLERTRELVRSFINADKPSEIFFSRGATDAFNQLAWQIGITSLQTGDEILYCPLDHASFVGPLHKMCSYLQSQGITVNLVPVGIRRTGGVDISDLREKANDKTKLVWVTHVHNVFGANSDIAEIRPLLKNKAIPIILDATQSVGHCTVDVQALDVDVLVAAGHKMFAGAGIGFVYARERSTSTSPLFPFFVGGGTGTEPGTLDLAGIASLEAAIHYIQEIGTETIHEHLSELTQYTLKEVRTLPNVEFVPGAHYWPCQDGLGILSFKLRNLNAMEVGFLLADTNICVRTGEHCLFQPNEYADTIRVSMHIYNNIADIDRLVQSLHTITKSLQI